MSKDTVALILEEIVVQMSNVMMQLAKIEQKVRTESINSGTQLPEDQLMMYLAQQFEQSLGAVSSSVYTKYNCTEEEAQAAVEYYEKDPKIEGHMTKLQQIIQVATG